MIATVLLSTAFTLPTTLLFYLAGLFIYKDRNIRKSIRVIGLFWSWFVASACAFLLSTQQVSPTLAIVMSSLIGVTLVMTLIFMNPKNYEKNSRKKR